MYACDYCLKTVDKGHLVSHAKNRVNTLRKPNLHHAKVLENGVIVKRNLCTKCLRSADRPHLQQVKVVEKTAETVVATP